jgi:cysteine desulfurase
VPDLVLTVDGPAQAPHVLNVCVPGADSEALLMHLDLAGVAVSSGSACTSGAVEPSHVLSAMGLPRELAIGAIRLSLGRSTTKAQLDTVAEIFPKVVAKVRALAGVLARA